MNTYLIKYLAKATVVVEASTEEAAISKVEKATLQAADELRIHLEPADNKFSTEKLDKETADKIKKGIYQ